MSDDIEKQDKPRKRVQVLLHHDIYEEVEKISKIGGISIGSLLAELLADTKPALVMIRESIEKAKLKDLEGALNRLNSGLFDAMEQGAELTKEINEQKTKLQK